MSMLRLNGVGLTLAGSPVLQEVTLNLGTGLVGLIGPNGAGKSSLLKVMAGIWRPSQGALWLNDKKCDAWNPRERASFLGYLPQNPACEWPMSVRQIIALGLERHAKDEVYLQQLLKDFDLAALADRPFDRISGGQQQRVMLARAFAGKPQIALLDEPVAAQDPAWQLRLLAWLRKQAETRCIVIALHDLALASRFCSHMVVMDKGFVKYSGLQEKVVNSALIGDVFGVALRTIEQEGQQCIIPWQITGNSSAA